MTEIQKAIDELNAQNRYLLLTQLFASSPEPDANDPELLAALDRGVADDDADRVHSFDEVRAMIPKWISKSPSPEAL